MQLLIIKGKHIDIKNNVESLLMDVYFPQMVDLLIHLLTKLGYQLLTIKWRTLILNDKIQWNVT